MRSRDRKSKRAAKGTNRSQRERECDGENREEGIDKEQRNGRREEQRKVR